MTKPLVTVAARRLLLLCVLVGSSPVVYARRNTLPAQMRLPADELGRQQLLLQNAGAAGPSSSCPCEPKTLCEPVTVQHEREVFGFTAGADYQQMDWDQVTTVAWSTDSQLVCEAHKHKARLVAAAPLTNITALGTNDEALQAWVGQVVAMVRSLHIDGVTFDYETPIAPGSPEAEMYVRIINATTTALHAQVPGSQTSVCVAWSPNNIDGRYYDILGFAAAADLLYIMMYDTRSQIFDQCIAGPNAGLPIVQLGVQQYLDLGVPAEQLILGVPWYGYDYPCLKGTAPSARFCPIKEVPFRGVNCSDAAGSEVGFSGIMKMADAGDTTTGGVMWDESVSSPWYNYRTSTGVIHQRWYDNATSLALKYQVAVDKQLRGVGPFTYSDLDYSTSKGRAEAKQMWDALKVFSHQPQ